MNDLIDTFHRLESNFFSMISLNQIDCGNLVAFASGVPAANLNPAIAHHIDELFSANLDACNAFYAQQNLPWALILPEHLDNQIVRDLLQNHSLTFSDKGVAMMMSFKEDSFSSMKTTLTIKNMENDLQTWSIPLLYGFESTPEITDIYTARHQSASMKNPGIYHFSGFLNDTVVCSLSLSCLDGYARIDDVSTIPAEQKKGYATQLICAALKHALSLNINTFFLEASSSGLGVYKRIGFEELFINHYYESQ
jgi:ribosomal protein S18 acetylase RimI-like enzyme